MRNKLRAILEMEFCPEGRPCDKKESCTDCRITQIIEYLKAKMPAREKELELNEGNGWEIGNRVGFNRAIDAMVALLEAERVSLLYLDVNDVCPKCGGNKWAGTPGTTSWNPCSVCHGTGVIPSPIVAGDEPKAGADDVYCDVCGKNMTYRHLGTTTGELAYKDTTHTATGMQVIMRCNDNSLKEFYQKQLGPYKLDKQYNICYECLLRRLGVVVKDQI
jgi:hypothetical protein